VWHFIALFQITRGWQTMTRPACQANNLSHSTVVILVINWIGHI